MLRHHHTRCLGTFEEKGDVMKSKRFVFLVCAVCAVALGVPALAQITPVGEELTIGAGRISSRVSGPVAAFGENGQVVLVWEAAGRGIVSRRLDAAGRPAGAEVVLAASDSPDGIPFTGPLTLHRNPAVAALDQGDFLAIWTEERQHVVADIFYQRSETLNSLVVAQRFDRAGRPAGRRSVLSGGGPGLAGSPRAIRLSDGRALAVWTTSEAGAADGIYGRLLSRRGSPIGPAFRVDSSAGSRGSRPALAAAGDGGFLVAWQGCCDGGGSGIFARRFQARAEPAGEAFLVNAVETGDQLWPAVSRSAAGEFLVAWMGPGGTFSELEQRIYGQVLSVDGAFLGPELTLSGGGGKAHGAPAVTGVGAGYLVAWTVWGTNFPQGIRAAEFDSAGAPQGDLVPLSTGRIGIQWQLSLAGDGDGRFLAAWEGFDGDGDPSINTRRLSKAEPDV
jgi:hypothetical protein